MKGFIILKDQNHEHLYLYNSLGMPCSIHTQHISVLRRYIDCKICRNSKSSTLTNSLQLRMILSFVLLSLNLVYEVITLTGALDPLRIRSCYARSIYWGVFKVFAELIILQIPMYLYLSSFSFDVITRKYKQFVLIIIV